MSAHIELGRRGEQIAADYLRERGYDVLDRNWRGSSGELDIVASGERDLVIVEVKTRRTMAYGDPLAAVDQRRLARLWRSGRDWARQHADLSRGKQLRLDVIGVLCDGADVQIAHQRDVR